MQMNTIASPYKKVLPRTGNTKIITGGRAYFDIIVNHIRSAKRFIHIQYYIIDDDETGRMILDELLVAAQRGVEIYILADGYASQNLAPDFFKKMEEANIRFKYFEPLLRSKYFYFGRRLHHKIFLVDMEVAIVGGINISNKYNDLPGKPAWLDFAVEVTGEITRDLCILCWKSWNRFPKNMTLTPCEKLNIVFDQSQHQSNIKLLRNDWVRRKMQISDSYYTMFAVAQKEVILLSSYFLPGTKLRRQMIKCMQRGVKISVVTTANSDVPISKSAERWLYDWLLRYNINIYEYHKTILHGKLGICDDNWFSLGSYNINDISAYASIELNLEIKDPQKTLELKNKINTIIKEDCTLITQDMHRSKTPLYIQFINFCAYESIRLLYYLFTFYFTQKE
jgi:cardiolipin synthase